MCPCPVSVISPAEWDVVDVSQRAYALGPASWTTRKSDEARLQYYIHRHWTLKAFRTSRKEHWVNVQKNWRVRVGVGRNLRLRVGSGISIMCSDHEAEQVLVCLEWLIHHISCFSHESARHYMVSARGNYHELNICFESNTDNDETIHKRNTGSITVTKDLYVEYQLVLLTSWT